MGSIFYYNYVNVVNLNIATSKIHTFKSLKTKNLEPLKEQYKYQHAESKLHLKCSDCGTDIPARDVNITETLAKCDNCNNIFKFDKEIFPEWKRRKPEMFIPEGMEVLKLPSELDIQFDWYNAHSKKGLGFKTFFTFMWNIMLLPFVLSLSLIHI